MKLSNNETVALASKLRDKARKDNELKKKSLIKAKMPEAKKIASTLNALPEAVLSDLTYERKIKPEYLAGVLAAADIPELPQLNHFEHEVTIAAIESTNLTGLCKKLGL